MRFFKRTKFKDIYGKYLCIGDKVIIYVRNGNIGEGVVVGTKKNPGVKNSVGILDIEKCLEELKCRSCPAINECCGDRYAVFEVI